MDWQNVCVGRGGRVEQSAGNGKVSWAASARMIHSQGAETTAKIRGEMLLATGEALAHRRTKTTRKIMLLGKPDVKYYFPRGAHWRQCTRVLEKLEALPFSPDFPVTAGA